MPKLGEDKKMKRQEALADVCEIIREKLQITTVPEKTFCYIVAIHENAAKNRPLQIHCRDCHAFGNYVYDSKNDCIIMQCVAFQEIGHVSCCPKISLEGTGCWRTFAPIPGEALKLFFSTAQAKEVSSFIAKYPSNEYAIHYIQMIACS